MAITIQGTKITKVYLTLNKEDGTTKLTGDYELISSQGVTLAKQGFNGYNELALASSVETTKALNELLAGLNKDLNATLGI